MTIRIKSHTVAVAIRTAAQALAGGGVTAAGLAALASYGRYLPAGWAAAAGVALTWLAGVAHNALEDHGIIGTWLRADTLTAATVSKQLTKAQDAADKQAAKLAAQAAAAAPVAAPVIDAMKAYVDQAIAEFAQQIPQLLGQTVAEQTPPPATVSSTTPPAVTTAAPVAQTPAPGA